MSKKDGTILVSKGVKFCSFCTNLVSSGQSYILFKGRVAHFECKDRIVARENETARLKEEKRKERERYTSDANLTAIQENESGPHEMGKRLSPKLCFVCKSEIREGQKYYRLTNCSYGKSRHIDCPRRSAGKIRREDVPSLQTIGQSTNGRVIRSNRGL